MTLPRCRATIAAAALWVGLQTVTEITVTDMMHSPHLRRGSVHAIRPARAWLQGTTPCARAVAVSLPLALLTARDRVVGARERTLPPLDCVRRRCVCFTSDGCAGLWFTVIFAVVAVLAGIPLASLVWKAGLEGVRPPGRRRRWFGRFASSCKRIMKC